MNLFKNNFVKTQKVAIYIDGSNFYFKLKSSSINIVNIAKFDYRGFANWLARDREIISCRYYVGVVKAKENDKKAQKLRKNQQKLFSHLTLPQQNFIIKRGYLMKNDNVYHEKGVDVKIAVDLVVGAYENIYDIAILISSDTDLIPAIKKVRHLGKQVEYIGFAHQPSFALQKNANLSRLLIKEEISQFMNND